MRFMDDSPRLYMLVKKPAGGAGSKGISGGVLGTSTKLGGGCGLDMPVAFFETAGGGATAMVGSGNGRVEGTTIDVDVERARLLFTLLPVPLC
jgi:hypothetical protein